MWRIRWICVSDSFQSSYEIGVFTETTQFLTFTAKKKQPFFNWDFRSRHISKESRCLGDLWWFQLKPCVNFTYVWVWVMVLCLSLRHSFVFEFESWFCVWVWVMVLCLSLSHGFVFEFESWFCVWVLGKCHIFGSHNLHFSVVDSMFFCCMTQTQTGKRHSQTQNNDPNSKAKQWLKLKHTTMIQTQTQNNDSNTEKWLKVKHKTMTQSQTQNHDSNSNTKP